MCGTRGAGNPQIVKDKLNELMWNQRSIYKDWKPDSIIEGCCPDSADVWAEEWATENNIPIQHHPATAGNYLKRNIEMCLKASLVIAFWDAWSYGTCFTIAQATARKIPVIVIKINKR